MANIFEAGETVVCSITVKDSDGTLTDPATSMNISAEQISPYSAVLSSTSMTKDSTGTYHYDLQTSTFAIGNYKVIYTATNSSRITKHTDTFNLI